MPINFWIKPQWSQHHIHWCKSQNCHWFQWWQVLLLAGISVLHWDHAELPAPRKISPHVLHSLCMEVNNVGQYPFTWFIKELVPLWLQKLKPDNKRRDMGEWKDCREQHDPYPVFNRNWGQIIDTKHLLSVESWAGENRGNTWIVSCLSNVWKRHQQIQQKPLLTYVQFQPHWKEQRKALFCGIVAELLPKWEMEFKKGNL